MATAFPRISISVNNNCESEKEGELNILSLGLGIHQTWFYAVMYGTATVFPNPPSVLSQNSDFPLSITSLVSTLTLILVLIFSGITDQKFLRFYTAKSVILGAAVLTSIGTFAIFGTSSGEAASLLSVLSGVATGVGSGFLLLFWGTAFSRHDSATIVLNTTVAIMFSVVFYLVVLFVIPASLSGFVAGVLPLLEIPMLWQLTPISYALRHAVPIFNGLPVRKLPFACKIAIPALLFGIVLGVLRLIVTQTVIPHADLTVQLISLFGGGAAVVILFVSSFYFDKRGHWDSLLRPLIPCIAFSLFFVHPLFEGFSEVSTFVLITGFICFEALMWIFLSELSQEFRISPVFVFSIGRSFLSIGALISSIALADPQTSQETTVVFGPMILMFLLLTAQALMPRVRNIKSAIIAAAQPAEGESRNIAAINRRIEIAAAAGKYTITSVDKPEQNEEGGDKKDTEASSADTSDKAEEPEQTRYVTRFKSTCEEIANRYLLSRRETEVMFLLAKGHNAAYIQEKLCISKSTAKTHIAHIYRKLSIHNQQELLIMVADPNDGKMNEPAVPSNGSQNGTR